MPVKKRQSKKALAITSTPLENSVGESSEIAALAAPVEMESNPLKNSVEPTPSKKVRQRKEKKPVQVVAIVTSDGIEGSFTPESRRPLIVHFPFNSTEIKFNDTALQYDPSPPPQVQPYDGDQNYFQVNSEISSDENQIGVELEGWKMSLEEHLKKQDPLFPLLPKDQETKKTDVKQNEKEKEKEKDKEVSKPYVLEKVEKAQLLKCYAVKTGETFTPPSSTDVHCFWCTHCFEGTPSFLPVKEESSVYHVYGNFCTPQCGLAYLLYEHMDSHVRWERMALLHRMYRSFGRLYPAPPRESLTTYGGYYSIEKFRELIGVNKLRVDVQVPPMISILGTLDTKPIDFYDSSLQNTFTQGFSLDRFKAWSEQGGALKALRLQRSKPLKDRESTLDACINISVKRGGD